MRRLNIIIPQNKNTDNVDLRDAAVLFYRHNKAKGLAEDTQKSYKDYVSNFLKWLGSDTISDTTFEDYILYKQERGVKMVSIASSMRHIRRFMNFCEEHGYHEHVDVLIPKYEKEIKEPYTRDEMALLLKKPRTRNWAEWRTWAMVNYFYATGQRLSTVLNIKVSDIDFTNRTVRLEWNKDKIQKYMPLPKNLTRLLSEYIMLAGIDKDGYLFPNNEGGQLKKRSAEDAVKDYNISRGVYKTSIHLFRHTFARDFIMNGGNPVVLQKLLNHKTMEMTMQYVNLYGCDISEDMERCCPLNGSGGRHTNVYPPP